MIIKRGFELMNKLVEEVPNQLNNVVFKYMNSEPIIEYRKGEIIIDKDFIEVFDLIENFNLKSSTPYFQSPYYLKEIPTDFVSLVMEHRIAMEKGDDNDLKRVCVFLFGLAVASNFEKKSATDILKTRISDFYEKKYSIRSIWNKIIGKTNQYYSINFDIFTIGSIALLLNKSIDFITDNCIDKIIKGEI